MFDSQYIIVFGVNYFCLCRLEQMFRNIKFVMFNFARIPSTIYFIWVKLNGATVVCATSWQ